jgi:hypothetical protein
LNFPHLDSVPRLAILDHSERNATLGEEMKPFIRIADRYVNVTSIAFVKVLQDGELWVALDEDGRTGIRIEKDAAPEFEKLFSQFVAFTV